MSDSKRYSLEQQLIIDPPRVVDTIVAFLRNQIKEYNAKGIVLGISGGIDSAVVAKLSVLAAGAPNVKAFYLFERDSHLRYQENAQHIADSMGIELFIDDITGLLEGNHSQVPAFKRYFPLYIVRNIIRVLTGSIYFLVHKSSLIKILKFTRITRIPFVKKLYQKSMKPLTDIFLLKHYVRKQIVEDYALKHDYLAVGAANRSEYLTGFFVRDGIDDLPVEPILGLYKNQVYQLAHFLEIPEKIINEIPSPDMYKGISDEAVLGLPWNKIDKVLYAIEKNVHSEHLLNQGITLHEIEKVKTMYSSSAIKRVTRNYYPEIK